MRVVVFGNISGLGGAQTAFRRMVDFLTEDGHNVGIIALADARDSLPTGNSVEFAIRVGNANTAKHLKFAGILGAAYQARRMRPDVFVSVGLAQSACLVGRLLPPPTYRVAHEFIYGRAISDTLLRSTNKAFDAIAVQAPSMVDVLKKQGYGELPLNWLPCFPELPVPGRQRNERHPGGVVRLAYFGRLAPNKGVDLLVKAFSQSTWAQMVILDIWGCGSESELLGALIKQLSLEKVRLRGKYPVGDEYARLICSYDGLVLPSTGVEGLPLILLEAMAYGVPLLTTNVGAISDCCNGNPDFLQVEPNAESIRRGLERFVAGLRSNTFSTSRLKQHYKEHFSYDVMSARWKDMFKSPREFFKSNV